MANMKNAKKRVLVNIKKEEANNKFEATMKTAIKNVERAVASKDKEKANDKLKVAVKAIKFNEVPEINDEFVKEVSEFDTLDEYKADTKKTLEERKAKQVEESRKAKLLSKVVETSTMDMPEPMVLEQCDQMINNFAQTLRYQGMDMQKYMEMTGSTIDTMRQSVRSEAERRLKESLVLEAIAKAENLEATDEDVEKELETMASMYGMEVDKLKAAVTEAETESIKGELKTKKALEFIAENAKA